MELQTLFLSYRSIYFILKFFLIPWRPAFGFNLTLLAIQSTGLRNPAMARKHFMSGVKDCVEYSSKSQLLQ